MLEPVKELRKRLSGGEVVYGSSVTLADPEVSAILAPPSDFMWYDLEHGGMSLEALRAHMQISHGCGRACIVRVPDGQRGTIKPILDGGADAILVPQVRTAKEVQRIVAECRYPPQGTRGVGPRVPADYGRIPVEEYASEANANLMAWVMIENRDAIEAIDDIMAIEDLDGIVIGPMDLSTSYGLMGQITHPTVDGAISRTIEAARKAGKFIGVGGGTRTEGLKEQFLDRGVQLVQFGCDFMYLSYFWTEIVAEYRETMKDFRVN